MKLHGEIEVSFDVGGIHNVDDSRGMLVKNELPGYNLFAGIGGKGINSRQDLSPKSLRVLGSNRSSGPL